MNMKPVTKHSPGPFYFCLLLTVFCLRVSAQGTAFTYQGRLNDGASSATGIYDFRFGIYDASASGNQAGHFITNSAVGVTNGLFTTTLDFGEGPTINPVKLRNHKDSNSIPVGTGE